LKGRWQELIEIPQPIWDELKSWARKLGVPTGEEIVDTKDDS